MNIVPTIGINIRKLFIIMIVFLSVNGCMSLAGTTEHEKNKIFIGTRQDLELLPYLANKDEPGWGMIGLIDLPFSLVMDTVFLPYTVVHYFSGTKNSQSPETENNKPVR